MNANKKEIGVIDCTPTWKGIYMIHVQAAANGLPSAIKELGRMAELADLANKHWEVIQQQEAAGYK